MDAEAVAQAIRFAHDQVIAPWFGALTSDEVDEKPAGDVVTVADRECERLLGPLLRDIEDVPVVGEEAVGQDPSLHLFSGAPS